MKVKTKAVIMLPDRTNSTVILKKTQIAEKVFKHGETMYILDANRFQLTYGRSRLMEKEVYATYYYRSGSPKPLPVPEFPEHENLGVSAEELRAIFTPWFYRQIAPIEETMWDKIQKFAPLIIIGLLAYAIYLLVELTNKVQQIPIPGVSQ
jgi:hypothetical protein